MFSGGLDSAVLLAMERRVYDPVWPIHVRAGLAWEEAEARAIARLLAVAPFDGHVKAVTTLHLDMRDVYPQHRARVESGGAVRAAEGRAACARPARRQSVS